MLIWPLGCLPWCPKFSTLHCRRSEIIRYRPICTLLTFIVGCNNFYFACTRIDNWHSIFITHFVKLDCTQTRTRQKAEAQVYNTITN